MLFLTIWPLDTALSVTPYPSVFSRFGPLGALTVVRFPPPTFFNFRPRRLLDLSASHKLCPSFFAIFCTYIPILRSITSFLSRFCALNVHQDGHFMGSGLSPHHDSLPLPPRSSSTTGTLYVSAVLPILGHIPFFVN